FREEPSQYPCWWPVEHSYVDAGGRVVMCIKVDDPKIGNCRTGQALPFDQRVGHRPGNYALPSDRYSARAVDGPAVHVFAQAFNLGYMGKNFGIVFGVCPEVKQVRNRSVDPDGLVDFKPRA